MKLKLEIEKGFSEIARYLFSDHVGFGDRVQFGRTIDGSKKIKMEVKDIKP